MPQYESPGVGNVQFLANSIQVFAGAEEPSAAQPTSPFCLHFSFLDEALATG